MMSQFHGRVIAFTLLLAAGVAFAQGPHPRQRGAARADIGQVDARKVDPAALPAGIRVIHDVRYGDGRLEAFDVYAPPHADNAPVIFIVHGGGWRRGDKSARGVVQNKVAHWVPRGIIVVSVDYPLLPTPPIDQAREFAAKARGFGSRVMVLPEDLSHREINAELGAPSTYTASIDKFLAGLDRALSARLH
ncbi:MAG TPA: hypothetical protein VFX04_08510 [Rhodanobacteraceae bacterium]|jgi:acetyl esterase/lipase|nr:hypothetical protein [Rhodanobacteraceae bacterium]